MAAVTLAFFSTTAGADDMSDNEKNLMNFYAAFSEGDLDALDKVLIEEGNVIVARSTFCGTHAGDFMGHAATGKSFTAKAIDVHHFNEDGMVTPLSP